MGRLCDLYHEEQLQQQVGTAFIINKNASIYGNGGIFGSKSGVLGYWPEENGPGFTLAVSEDTGDAVPKHQSG